MISKIFISSSKNITSKGIINTFGSLQQMKNELSILNNKDKFRIIFFADTESEFDLIIKSKNKILNQQKVQISKQITLPGNEKWFQLGKTNDLSVILSNDDTNLELKYKIIPLHSVKEFNINKMNLTGKEKELEINYFPDSENIKFEDKSYNALHFNFSSTDKKLDKNKKLNTEVWYDEETLNWVKATFEKSGKWEYILVLIK